MSMWYWVRHGPTHAKTFVGWRDLPADLSDTAALERLRAYLPDAAIVVASDLRRASATADALDGRRLPDRPQLREFHFGAWDGQAFGRIAEDFPTLSRAYWETPGDPCPPGGESWNTAANRIETAVTQIEAAHQGPFIAVAHIGVILTQVQRVMGLTPMQAIGHKIDNLSVTSLDRSAGTGVINHVA